MRPKELHHQLTAAFANHEQILVKGPPGVGKTAIISAAAEAAGRHLVLMHPAIADPTDFRGLPARAANGTEATFLPFGDLAALLTTKQPTVCFVDDLGQAPESVQKALMQLLHGRRLNGLRLPDHVTFVGATNDVRQQSGVTGLIEPVKSRWSAIVTLDGHVDDWTAWALTQPHIPPVLIAFLRSPEAQNPTSNCALLFDWKPSREITNSPCPRTWEAVGRMLHRGCRHHEMLAGAVGTPAAAQLTAFLEVADKCPGMAEIMLDPEGTPVPDSPSLAALVATAIGRCLDPKTITSLFRYLWRMPQPYRILSVGDAHRRLAGNPKGLQAITETRPYVDWAVREGSLLAT